ncbi:hypothetical protein [Nocardioides antri]|uniref:Uncharacterized protein n=1 Tax=Nocardioides antri TaxID=2607659 RepID=A0A5B1M8L7_9ACTN|nr:hypothetical protein [Nocardioides antri]KAA1428878.1 hypothetical protein F0U47_01280 [Nocardioides antri]
MDEREVERVFRDGLQARAEDADVAVPVVARALAEVRHRRHRRWAVSAAAAAAVVLVVGGVEVLTNRSDDPASPPVVDDGPWTEVRPPTEDDKWRTEYWQGVAVDVPVEWGYGGAPTDGRTACYPEAMVGPDGSRLEGAIEQGWVGRPIAVTDVCALVPDAWEPTAPFAWLGADVEPGTYEYADGYVQETIEVAGTTVTVGTDDADLREEILASARPGHLCEPTLAKIPRASAGASIERRGGLILAQVCAYRREGPGGFDLSYATELSPAAVETAFAAAERAPAPPPVDCAGQRSEFVVLHATYNDEFPNDVLDRTAVYDMFCGGTVDLGPGPGLRALTPAAVEPLARNGIPSVVYGPSGGKGAMIDSFIGPLG